MIRAANIATLIAALENRGYGVKMIKETVARHKELCEKVSSGISDSTERRIATSEVFMCEHYICGVVYGLQMAGVTDAITYSNIWNDIRKEWEGTKSA